VDKTKTIYKVCECSKCKTIIELKLVGEEYIGDCKTCKREIKVKEMK